MNDDEIAENKAFPLEEAASWLGRWKEADGGFIFHDQGDGEVMVQLAHKGTEDTEARKALQAELLHDPSLKSAVITLAANAWKQKRAEQDLLNQEPQGHA